MQLRPTKDGGVALVISFAGARPLVPQNHGRYELAEFIGTLDVECEIDGEIFYPKLVCKLFCELSPAQAKKAQWDYALERARQYSPLLK